MPGEALRFTPELLNSYSNLQEYLVGERTEDKVRQQVVDASKQWHTNWMGRWNAVPLIMTDGLRAIYGLFALAVGGVLFNLGLKTWGLYFDLHGNIALDDMRSSHYLKHGQDFLASSVNSYAPEAADLYALPALPVENIESYEVRDTIPSVRATLSFDKNDGFCRGESIWMIRAYLKTRALFENHRQHLQAVGSLFSWGAAPEPALVQKLCPQDDLLKLYRVAETDVPCDSETIGNQKEACKQILDVIKDLEPGAYYVQVPQHAMAYFCPEKGQGYWFDPNKGTVALHDDEGFQKFANTIFFYHLHRSKVQSAEFWDERFAVFNQMETLD